MPQVVHRIAQKLRGRTVGDAGAEALPRWVRAFVIVAVAVALVVVILVVTGGHTPVQHGP